MRKSIEEKYDQNPYVLIKADLDLLVKNAMIFNMPKDEAHYCAKILQIVGSKFLFYVKDLLQSNEQVLINQNLHNNFRHEKRKKTFYTDIYEHFLDYLLNQRSQQSAIQVKGQSNISSQQQQYFSTKIFLNRTFGYAELKLRRKKKSYQIQNLFNILSLSNAGAIHSHENLQLLSCSNKSNFFYCPNAGKFIEVQEYVSKIEFIDHGDLTQNKIASGHQKDQFFISFREMGEQILYEDGSNIYKILLNVKLSNFDGFYLKIKQS